MSSSSSDRHSLGSSRYLASCELRPGHHQIVLWPYDQNGHIVLMTISSSIDLNKTADQVGLYGGRNITSLPSELLWAILSHLSPVDRICFGLSCKKLAATVAAVCRPHGVHWIHIPDPRFSFADPEHHLLIPRLAHGWIDKTKFRYCWKCCKILPRDPQYFRQRLRSAQKPPWKMKVGMEEKKWRRLRKRDRYEHLIRIWCDDKHEDSSCLSCDDCRGEYITAYSQRVPELFKQSPDTACYQLSSQQPVQCPTCFGAELCGEPLPRPKGRPLWYKILRPVAGVVFIGVGMFLYVLYLILIRGPWLLGKKAWNKIHSKLGRKVYWRYWLRRLKLRFQHE